MDLIRTLFALTLTAEILLGGSLVLTLLQPELRIWPPPSRRSWQFRLTWSLTGLSLLGVVALGVLDYNSLPWRPPLLKILGGLLIVAGNALALWGVRTLSVQSSLGLRGKLVTSGPYRFTRNPQYVGDLILLVGMALVFNSLYATIACLLGMVWFLLAPFTEEPWLEAQYGAAYRQYMRRVPRFLGLPRRTPAPEKDNS